MTDVATHSLVPSEALTEDHSESRHLIQGSFGDAPEAVSSAAVPVGLKARKSERVSYQRVDYSKYGRRMRPKGPPPPPDWIVR